MEQFNLDTWLKDKSRKVTTRLGNREVRIICYDRKNNNNKPIITLMIDPDGNEYTTFHTKNGFVDETEKYIDKRDLFFADEKEELTEFEKMLRYVLECYSGHEFASKSEIETLKLNAKPLFDLVRNEIEKEDCGKPLRLYKNVYERGKQDALKDLPKWKKSTEYKDLEMHMAILEDNKVLLSNYLEEGDYYIVLDDLKTLPKEE